MMKKWKILREYDLVKYSEIKYTIQRETRGKPLKIELSVWEGETGDE